jgi:uncharacterized protein YjbI with pentapeptide repeats
VGEKKAVDCWTKKAKAGEKNLVKAYLIKADLTKTEFVDAIVKGLRLTGAISSGHVLVQAKK